MRDASRIRDTMPRSKATTRTATEAERAFMLKPCENCGKEILAHGQRDDRFLCVDCAQIEHVCIDCGLPIEESAGKYGCCGNGWKRAPWLQPKA